MAWNLRFYIAPGGGHPVQEWIESLTQDAQAEVAASIRLLRRHGTTLGMPHARYLGQELWELRARGRDGIYRVLYFHVSGHSFGLVHGFTKTTQKTPPGEIEVARSRMRIWRAREGRRNRNDRGQGRES